MPERVIAAVGRGEAEAPLYFRGYQDAGGSWVCWWTRDRAEARRLDADEARLLAPRHAGGALVILTPGA